MIARRSRRVLGPMICAHIRVAHSLAGCRPVSGQRRRRSARIWTELIPASRGCRPAAATSRRRSRFVANRTSCPASCTARARSSNGTMWPSAGTALTRTRMSMFYCYASRHATLGKGRQCRTTDIACRTTAELSPSVRGARLAPRLRPATLRRRHRQLPRLTSAITLVCGW